MRIRSMFHTFVAVMAMLTFSAPFTLLAQQVPMQMQTEFAAAQDTNTMRLDVKTAAKRHINHDLAGSPGHSCIEFFVDGLVRPWIEDRVSSLGHSWIERYGCVGCISPIVGTSLGCIIGAMIDPEDEGGLDSFGLVGPTKGMMVGALTRGLYRCRSFRSFGCRLTIHRDHHPHRRSGSSENRLNILSFTPMPIGNKPKVFGMAVP